MDEIIREIYRLIGSALHNQFSDTRTNSQTSKDISDINQY